ncbi:MAG: hypothetical protein HOP19_07765 [Acidobacteria bacterium]|nr:hypothetical protein [Acidobacteriota bacterium]
MKRYALIAFVSLLASLHNSAAHEPITTKVTFNKEIARILQRSCWGCHAPGKIRSDIALATYEEARPWAKAIKEEVLERRMPPYQAVKGYGLFKHDYLLPQRDIELIVSWVEGGAPRGNLNDYPKPKPAWALGKPDALLQPDAPAEINKAEEVRCYSLATNFAEDRWINAFDFVPGNAAIVQRAAYLIETPANKAACDINTISPDLLGTWQPNEAPLQFPHDTARRLSAGARIKLIVHYRQTNPDDKANDQSQLGFYFSHEHERQPRALRNLWLKPLTTTLLVSDKPQRVLASQTITAATEAVAIRPLLFPFGTSIQATAHFPNGTSEVLIWAKDYHFAWQPLYVFRKPVALPKGTRLEITAYLDNSENNPRNPDEAPRSVTFKEPLCELLTAPLALQR